MSDVSVAVVATADLSPGKCSHGGEENVMDVDGDEMIAKFTVMYTEP